MFDSDTLARVRAATGAQDARVLRPDSMITKEYKVGRVNVVVDPGRPVPRWHLSDKGIARMRIFAGAPDARAVRSVWASDSTRSPTTSDQESGRTPNHFVTLPAAISAKSARRS